MVNFHEMRKAAGGRKRPRRAVVPVSDAQRQDDYWGLLFECDGVRVIVLDDPQPVFVLFRVSPDCLSGDPLERQGTFTNRLDLVSRCFDLRNFKVSSNLFDELQEMADTPVQALAAFARAARR